MVSGSATSTNSICELDSGGLSQVFVAMERALGRQVVVKALPADMAGQVSVERFQREIALAARLQHPHIVPLLTAGETGGLPYFTMPRWKANRSAPASCAKVSCRSRKGCDCCARS